MKRSIIALSVVLISPGIVHAKGWRGLVPLHSTCADVKRLLGVTTCEPTTYQLGDETVQISFTNKPCIDGWNVPPNTVLTIDVHPKPGLRLADLHIDESKYKKVADKHVRGILYYENEEEGITITVFPDGLVGSFFYGPAATDSYLRYPNSQADQPPANGDPHSLLKFDEYGDISVREEQKRLNNFVVQLLAEPKTQGYILVYAGRRARPGEAQARAERAKNYLANARGVESSRLTTVDGGYRKELTVELFVGPQGVSPVASPTVCPSEVQIIKPGKAWKNRRIARRRK